MEAKKSDLIRAFVKGGTLSPADLQKIMQISKGLGNTFILFGSRQDIMFLSNGTLAEKLTESFQSVGIDFELGGDQSVHQNIVSSYVTVNLVETTSWLKEDGYHLVMDNVDYKPKLKINIVDPVQSLVPLFTGELNFIASPTDNYWYLYIRDPRKANALECWPRLVASQDIVKLSKRLEELFVTYEPFSLHDLYMIVKNELHITYKHIEEKLKFSHTVFPYYEGLNAMLNNQYWLGLYWRNNQYDIDFMTEACALCQQTDINKFNIIPWKAFIVKGIKAKERLLWEKLMGKYGINERHSSLELNWHLPVMDQKALELKRFLVRELDQQDINTSRLTFTIKTHRDFFLFTTIVIELSQERTPFPGDHYTILVARNFNPNHGVYYPYAMHVKKEIIPALLIELSKLYFQQLHPETDEPGAEPEVIATPLGRFVYQCIHCHTRYDQTYGDMTASIPPGVPFKDLPEEYACPVCEAPAIDFIKIAIKDI